MVLNLPWGQKRMFSAFENGIFHFYTNLWAAKLKPFSGKAKQYFVNFWCLAVFDRRFLKNDFQSLCHFLRQSLREKCSNSELFWSTFSPYSVRKWENADQNNSEYGRLLSREYLHGFFNISNIFNMPFEYSIVAILIKKSLNNFCLLLGLHLVACKWHSEWYRSFINAFYSQFK